MHTLAQPPTPSQPARLDPGAGIVPAPRRSRSKPVRRTRRRGAPGVADEISRNLGEVWARYRRLLRRAQRKLSIESVHDLRVQTRRLLVCLDLFSPLVGAMKDSDSARRALAKRLAVLGPLRDAHVQLIDLEDRLPDFPEAIPLHFHLHRRAARLGREVEKALRKTGTAKLGRRLLAIRRDLTKALETDGGLDRLRALRRQSLEQGLARLAASRNDGLRNEGLVHEARIALKHLRYGAEALTAGVRSMSNLQILHLKKVAAVLGQIHDIDVHRFRVAKLESKGRLLSDSLSSYCTHLARHRRRLVTRGLRLIGARSMPTTARDESPVDKRVASI